MNMFWKHAKKMLSASCAVFTVLYFLFLIVASPMDITPALPLKTSVILYLLALLLSACDMIFEIKNLKFFVKILIHLVATFASIAVAAGFAGYDFSHRTFLILFVFLFIYAIVCPIYILIGKKHKKSEKKDSGNEYTSIFKKD